MLLAAALRDTCLSAATLRQNSVAPNVAQLSDTLSLPDHSETTRCL
jgi:hypothetical protein